MYRIYVRATGKLLCEVSELELDLFVMLMGASLCEYRVEGKR